MRHQNDHDYCPVLPAVCITMLTSADEIAAADEQVSDTVQRFLSAFEVGDLGVMEAAFAEDATTFPLVTMANDLETEIDADACRRVRGLPRQMTELVAAFREQGHEPPYMSLTPEDLELQVHGDVALVSFHLVNDQRLGRRTIVLARRDDAWKIVHLHASNVSTTD